MSRRPVFEMSNNFARSELQARTGLSDSERLELLTRLEKDGSRVGLRPDDAGSVLLHRCGLPRRSALAAMRLKCLDCCSEVASEVAKCAAVGCPLWPFRMGTDPYRRKVERSPEQRAELAARLARARSARQKRE